MKLKQYPLSPLQQGMLFHSLYEPDAGFYIQQLVCTLRERVDAALLHRAWLQVVERHAVLRTSFNWEGLQEPVQEVHSTIELEFDVKDWRDFNPEVHRQRFNEYLRADRLRGFDLSKAPLMRIVLFQLADHCQMLWTFHHNVLDGRSDFLLLTEVLGIYDSASRGEQLELQDSRPYSDYIEWLQKNEHPNSESFWRERLSGFVAPTPLPERNKVTTRIMPEQRHTVREVRVSESVTSELKSLAAQNEVTLNNLVQGSWALLLSRHSGEEDVVFGTTRACRRGTVEGADSMVGLFINTVPFRVRVDPKLPLVDWLKQLRSQHVSLRPYEHTSLLKIQEWSEVPRGTLLFETVFAFENYQWSSRFRAMGDPWASREVQVIQQTNYPLTFSAAAGSDLVLKLEYDQARFEAQSIDRMLAQLKTVLKAMVTHPDQQIGKLSLITEEERQQVLVEWNQTAVDLPEKCLHQLFEEQVNRNPERIAVVYEDQKLTYAELNARANQLARHLRLLGVGPETIVGICIERSLEMVIGLLGILKAGGAYLPLDPAYPRERLSFILENGRARVLLSQEHLKATLPAHSGKTIYLDRDWKEIEQETADKPENTAMPENLAYVMYTSGSTGKPKGVAIPHRAVVRLVQNANYAHFGPDEVFLQFAPLAFDASTFEIWGSLLNGGRLVVMPPGLVSLTNLGEAVKRQKVTTLWLTAGLFHQMVETELESLRGVRQLIAGGSVLSVAHVEQAARELIGCQLINGYGPTENTTFTCCYPVKPQEEFTSSVPIGFPISNTQVYILDNQLSPVPIGVAGELYTGGAGLASGYLNRPALTAEKFIPHPFSAEPGARLYRTGDRARYRADGSIEFLERVDHQVKLRGYRIELGEVETAIKEHPAVRDAVVVVGQSAQGDKHLVSYFVADPNHPESGNRVLSKELKGLLKKTLPDFMIPSYFVPLDHLPLMRSGKIDRRALPQPNGMRPELEEVHIAPRDDFERRLAHIWETLLGLQSVGIRDNFFDLGGHSLLAVRLVSEIEKAFGQRLPLISLFQGSTIEYLAGLLRKHVASISWPTLIEIQAGDSKCPLFCVSHPNVNALGYRSLARHLGPEQSVFGLQAQYPEDLIGEYSQAAVDRMATEYLESLRAVRPTGPYQFVGICRGAHIAYEIARRLEQEGQEVAMLGILDTWVAENTYSIFFYLDHYAHRLISLSKTNLSSQINFIKKKARRALRKLDSKILARESAQHKRNPLHELYFPGPEFVPRTYNGRIAVFRVRRQTRQRIRDVALGWRRLALGGVDVHFIPGDHSSVLKEPYVQGLATELKKRLL